MTLASPATIAQTHAYAEIRDMLDATSRVHHLRHHHRLLIGARNRSAHETPAQTLKSWSLSGTTRSPLPRTRSLPTNSEALRGRSNDSLIFCPAGRMMCVIPPADPSDRSMEKL